MNIERIEDMENLTSSEAKLYEELKSITRLIDFLPWEYSCNLVIDKMKQFVTDQSLHVGTRSSLICRYTRLESHLEILRRQFIHAGGGIKRKAVDSHEMYWQEIETAFSGRLTTGAVMNVDYVDPQRFLMDAENLVIKHVREYIAKYTNIKVNTIFNAEFMLKEKVDAKGLNSKNRNLSVTSDLHEWYLEHVVKPTMVELEEFQERDSGWALHRIINLIININKHNPFRAGCYEELPIDIKNKKAIINIVSYDDDNACFAHAVVAALYPARSNVSCLCMYPDYQAVLNLSGIVFPMTLQQIEKFEKQNNISINVYTDERYTDDECKKMIIVPLYLSKLYKEEERHIDIFYIPKSSGGGGHFALIKNLSRLVGSQLSRYQHKKYICRR